MAILPILTVSDKTLFNPFKQIAKHFLVSDRPIKCLVKMGGFADLQVTTNCKLSFSNSLVTELTPNTIWDLK